MRAVTATATNADLYFAVSQLIAQYQESTRPLEEYLRALWNVAPRHRGQESLTPDEFLDLLAEAFVAEPVPYEADLEPYSGPDFEPSVCHLFDVEIVLVGQIIDLREMAASGQLANPHRYFGIDSPRGERWYNFDPCTFLECASRYWVDRHGGSPSLTAISWGDFCDFLAAGQGYE